MSVRRDSVTYRRCVDRDYDSVYFIINEAAASYRGLIPANRSLDPYMSREEFRHEISAGVEFWGHEENEALRGVMGVQRVADVVLIRHAYIRPEYQNLGIGSGLLRLLLSRTRRPVLVGHLGRCGASYQVLRTPWIRARAAADGWRVVEKVLGRSVRPGRRIGGVDERAERATR